MEAKNRTTEEQKKFNESQKNRVKVGKEWECMVVASCEYYKSIGIADVEQIAIPYKVVGAVAGKPFIFKGIRSRRPGTDFLGMTFNRGLRTDTKSTQNRTKWSLTKVETHQAGALLRCAELGGISGVCLFARDLEEPEAYWIPSVSFDAISDAVPMEWAYLMSKEDRTTISVSFEKLRSAGLQIYKVNGIWDFLGTALRTERRRLASPNEKQQKTP